MRTAKMQDSICLNIWNFNPLKCPVSEQAGLKLTLSVALNGMFLLLAECHINKLFKFFFVVCLVLYKLNINLV